MQIVGVLGATLVVLSLAQVGLLFMSERRRRLGERKQDQLALDLLQARVGVALGQRADAERSHLAWNGFRKFVVFRKVREADGVCSFYLRPHDRKSLPSFQPGQYLTFQIPIRGQAKQEIRCYSLSDAPQANYYRVTIKRVTSPRDDSRPSRPSVSNYFHDHVQEGAILDVKAPCGKFFLELSSRTPVVLIAGGVGIAPMLSMVNALARLHADREVWLFCGVRRGSEHVRKSHLHELTTAYNNLRVFSCYSDPRPHEVLGEDFDVKGRVTGEVLRRLLPSNDFEFFICGPPPMMADLTRDLLDWGVPEQAIHTEAFGPATVKQMAAASDAFAPVASAPSSAVIQVTFSKSGKRLRWNPGAGSLLKLARANGVEVPSGCEAGDCGTCAVALKAGAVRHLRRPGCDVQRGPCLTCVTVPSEDVVLDA